MHTCRPVHLALFFAIVLLGCIAPHPVSSKTPRRTMGFDVSDGKLTDRVQEFVTRLSDRFNIEPRLYKFWMDVKTDSESQKTLGKLVFEEGTNTNPKVIALGTGNTGAHLAVAVVKPDRAAAVILASRRAKKARGWDTRSGLALMHLKSNEQPNMVGWLRFKNHAVPKRLKTLPEMISLDSFERLHGLTGVIRAA